MTSFSARKKTSLSQTRCIMDENLLWNTSRKPWSPFQNPSLKIAYTAPPSGYSTMTSVPVCKKTSFSRKQCMMKMNFLLISFRKMLSLFQNPPFRTVHSALQRKYHEGVLPVCKWKHYMSETVQDRRKLSDERQYEVEIVLLNSVSEN